MSKAHPRGHTELSDSLTFSSWTQTDLGNQGAEFFGYEQAAITVEQSVTGVIKVIDAATRETHGGKLWTWEGRQMPW